MIDLRPRHNAIRTATLIPPGLVGFAALCLAVASNSPVPIIVGLLPLVWIAKVFESVCPMVAREAGLEIGEDLIRWCNTTAPRFVFPLLPGAWITIRWMGRERELLIVAPREDIEAIARMRTTKRVEPQISAYRGITP